MTCQSCSGSRLTDVIDLGELPSANVMTSDAPRYPTRVVKCHDCQLVQLDTIVDPDLIFPHDYAYTSGTTVSLRANFADLAAKAGTPRSVLDIGCNDGSLLEAFRTLGWDVHGVEPTNQVFKARDKGIRTTHDFFTQYTADRLGDFDVVTATNVFAHIDAIHSALDGIKKVLKPGGVFITESTYWGDTLAKTQYDTIYHEHLRYYTLTSLSNLLAQYGLVPFRVERIGTMGGSIRVYASEDRDVENSVVEMLEAERSLSEDGFAERVVRSKDDLLMMLPQGVYGIGSPSRATTLLNYTGLNLEAVCEIAGSDKIGKVIPGTTIPIVDERVLYETQPENALLLSWHLEGELIPKIRAKGYKGRFWSPLPSPHIVQ